MYECLNTHTQIRPRYAVPLQRIINIYVVLYTDMQTNSV